MKRIICLFILSAFLIVMYSLYIEPYSFAVYEYSIKNENIPKSFNGLKITHISDILYKNHNDFNFLSKSLEEINSLNSDIIFFTGDLANGKITNNDEKDLNKLLSKLNAKLYKYAILGDRDSNKAKEILEKNDFIILDNSSTLLFNKSSEPILIAGGDNLNDDILITDENVTYNYKIALIHKPDYYDTIKDDYNLVLAGHSLGGKVRVPYLGATIKKSGAQKYTDKYYSYKENELYISFGVGTDGHKFRFLNKPSVNVYRLYSK